MNLFPYTAPALSDDDGAPVRELSHRGSHSGGVPSYTLRFSWFECEPDQFMPVSTEQIFY